MNYSKKANDEFNISYRDKVNVKKGVKSIDLEKKAGKSKPLPLLLQVGSSLGMVLVMLVGITLRAAISSSPAMAVISSVTVVGSLIGMILIPILTRNYRKKSDAVDEVRRQRKQMRILDRIDANLDRELTNERGYYDKTFPPLADCVDAAAAGDHRLWQIQPKDDDFMVASIGVTSVPASFMPELKRDDEASEEGGDDDPIYEETQKLIRQYGRVDGVPALIDFKKEIFIGVTGDEAAYNDLARCLVARLAFSHPYTELKFVFVLNKAAVPSELDFVRWVPHVWNDDRSERYIFTYDTVDDFVEKHLSPIVRERVDKIENDSAGDDRFLPHYVVFISGGKNSDGGDWTNTMLFSEFFTPTLDLSQAGISFVVYGKSKGDLPRECTLAILLSRWEDSAGVLRQKSVLVRDEDNFALNFKAESPKRVSDKGADEELDFMSAARSMFRLRLKETGKANKLPDNLPFLEMWDAIEVNDLKASLWKENTANGIRAAVGKGALGKTFEIDISEGKDGPHGLIAGTTGSGKSELISTFILSLSIRYSPRDVAFFIIDHKGGGLSNQFKNLPHLAGMFTNLDKKRSDRTLTAMATEVTRRQKRFEESGVKDITEYKRGGGVMPHLVIVVDEFAELKNRDPNFINELVSLARVGRSLGIHLVLATQRPAGNINQEIQSNSNFRICLKVANTEDSRDVIGDKSAADIKIPGRGYIKSGSSKPKIAQTAYSGAEYTTDKERAMLNKSYVGVVSLSGPKLESAAKILVKTNGKEESQLARVVELLRKAAGDSHADTLLLPPLGNVITYDSIAKDNIGGNYFRAPFIGRLDKVAERVQEPLHAEFGKLGNLLLMGTVKSGKTVFVQTTVLSLSQRYGADELHMYILEGRSGLKILEDLPHVGEVISVKTEGYQKKAKKLTTILNRELSKRMKAFDARGAVDIEAYRVLTKESVPYILVIVDPISVFYTPELWEQGETYEEFVKLCRDGSSYGIYFLLTANGTNDVKYSFSPYFSYKMALELSPGSDYSAAVGAKAPKLVENMSGRGLAAVDKVAFEFQATMFGSGNTKDGEFDDDRYYLELIANVDRIKREKSDVGLSLRPKPVEPNIPANLAEALDGQREDKETELVTYFADKRVREKIEQGRLVIGFDNVFGEAVCISANKPGTFFFVSPSSAVLRNAILRVMEMYRIMGFGDDRMIWFDAQCSTEELEARLGRFFNDAIRPRANKIDVDYETFVILIDNLNDFHVRLPERFVSDYIKDDYGNDMLINRMLMAFETVYKINVKVFVGGRPEDTAVWSEPTYEPLIRRSLGGVIMTRQLSTFTKIGVGNATFAAQSKILPDGEAHFVNANIYGGGILMFAEDAEILNEGYKDA